jgi:hypothetical protein
MFRNKRFYTKLISHDGVKRITSDKSILSRKADLLFSLLFPIFIVNQKKNRNCKKTKKRLERYHYIPFFRNFFNIDKNQRDLVSLHKIAIMSRVSKLTAILAHRGDTLYCSLQLPILRA